MSLSEYELLNMEETQGVFECVKEVDRLRFVNRWNGHFAFDRSDIAQHTFRVLMWSRCLISCLDKKNYFDNDLYRFKIGYEAMTYALYHDMGEIYTGDVRHDIKRSYDGLKDLLDKVEECEVSKHIDWNDHEVGDISVKAKRIVKVGDMLDFTYESLKEIHLGNKEPEYHKAIFRGQQIMKNNLPCEISELGLSVSEKLFQHYKYTVFNSIEEINGAFK